MAALSAQLESVHASTMAHSTAHNLFGMLMDPKDIGRERYKVKKKK
jgi:hypothetical protein